MNERFIEANGLTLCMEEFGSKADPALFLVMGLGTQMISWPEDFVSRLVNEGFRVIRFDNRDVGRSTNMDHLGQPSLPKAMMNALVGRRGSPRYHLEDMAADLIALMDALEIDSAHVAGASMGGMISQVAALRHPERIRSLTSIMSSYGAHPLKNRAKPAAMKMLLSRPQGTTVPDIENHIIRVFDTIGSPAYPYDESELRARARMAVSRGINVSGTGRQLEAVLSAGKQAHRLKKIKAPALILHGEEDPLIPVGAGIHNAENIPGARLVTYPGMGHDLPDGLRLNIADEIASHAKMAEKGLLRAA